jgi:hypothetical protein
MMNGVGELFSLLCFLRIKPYCVWDQFRQVNPFSSPLYCMLRVIELTIGRVLVCSLAKMAIPKVSP